MTDSASKQKAEKRAQQGIECPSCGCRHIPVLYTRHRSRKTVRVRQCRNCGRRVVTYEQVG